MRQLDTTYHSGMAGYLMGFGFGGFIGYGKGVSLEMVMEELNISMRCQGTRCQGTGQWHLLKLTR